MAEVVKKSKEIRDICIANNASEVFIWDGDELFHLALKEALKDIKQASLKMRIRGCENKYFKEGVILYKGESKVREFEKIAEIKDIIDEIDDSYYFVVKSNQIKDVMELIQQLVYIGKSIPVFTEEDLQYKKVYTDLLRYKDSINNYLESLKDLVEKRLSDKIVASHNDKEIVNNIRDNIVKSISGAMRELSKVDKEIKIAVIATKKSGKSMVVNCIVGEEYAPTSQELPTPNIITYIPSEENDVLKLKYKGKLEKFDSSERLKEYITKEFERVQDGGKALEDMEIYYPHKGKIKFYVLDTPGPDLAKSEHNKIDKILGDEVDKVSSFGPDIVVFVIDYTKHAQNSEIKLFEIIRENFEKRGISDMVICLVNKIDTMFSDGDVEKSKLRVAAFINNKLKEIGYDNIVVIPTSALMYFYMHKLLERFGDELKNTENVLELLTEKGRSKDLKREESLKTYMKTMKFFVDSMFDMFEEEEEKNTVEDVMEFSGIKLFLNYLNSIVSAKAEAKKAKEIATRLEFYLNTVRNSIENLGYKDFEKKAFFLKDRFSNLRNTVENLANREILNLGRQISQEIEEVEDRTKSDLKDIADRIKTKISRDIEIFKEQKLVEILEDVKSLKVDKLGRDYFEKKWTNIEVPKEELFDQSYIKNVVDGKFSDIRLRLEHKQDEFNMKIEKIHKDLHEKFENFQNEIKRDYGITLDIRLPKILLSVDFDLIYNSIENSVNEYIRELKHLNLPKRVFSEGIKGGFFRLLGFIFGLTDRYNTTKFEQEVVNILDGFVNDAKRDIDSVIYGKNYLSMLEKIDKEFNHLKLQNRETIEIYKTEIEKIVVNFDNFVNLDVESCKRVSMLFNEIGNNDSYKALIKIWDEEIVNLISTKTKKYERRVRDESN